MNKENYEKLKAKPVLFDLEEVYMLDLESKSDGGGENFIPDDDDNSEDDWNV